jgi:hypothetical protein
MDTVVKLCRGRETDEKRVAAEIYDAGNARQRDGNAKRMVRQDLAVATKKSRSFLPR